jgi:RimJ/RimL family protein N-acetyltransferase
LRPLTGADWRALRDLRLHALRSEHGLFFRAFDEEAGLTQAEWTALASGDDAHQIFGLFDDDRLVGISGVFTDIADPSGATAGFGMSYLLPAYRGRGFAARFYAARLAWARARPQFRRAAIGHRRSNAASRRLIERFGFRHTHDAPYRWPDGSEEDDCCYELPLRDDDAS